MCISSMEVLKHFATENYIQRLDIVVNPYEYFVILVQKVIHDDLI